MRCRGIGLALALLASTWAPSPARACGGLFCNQANPVVQSGENILFSYAADGSVTAYVQIRYSGPPTAFAWIVPVAETPELDVGTDALFTALESATAPRFVTTPRTDGACRAPPTCVGPPDAGECAPGMGSICAADGGVGPPVEVINASVVGPYDAVVLAGVSGAAVQDWLTTHGYAIPVGTAPLLDAYVTTGHSFVAVRLTNGARTNDITPLVLRHVGHEACIPIQLTAIATSPDLPVTAYFLAEGRAVPVSYGALAASPENEASLYLGASYSTWLTRAVVAEGGHAFATDYAGAPPDPGLTLPALGALPSDPCAFVLSLPQAYLRDATMRVLLVEQIHPPPTMTSITYLNSIVSSRRCAPGASYDPAATAALIEERVARPRREADALLAAAPRLTRLATSLRASDMTLDPTFRIDPALGDVSNVHTATDVRECSLAHLDEDAPHHLELPSGQIVVTSPGSASDDAAYCAARGQRLAIALARSALAVGARVRGGREASPTTAEKRRTAPHARRATGR
jgi:hypothetical protein